MRIVILQRILPEQLSQICGCPEVANLLLQAFTGVAKQYQQCSSKLVVRSVFERLYRKGILGFHLLTNLAG